MQVTGPIQRIRALLGMTTAVCGLFWMAGTAAWWNAWAFLPLLILISVFTLRLINSSPGLAEERRSAAARAKPWDINLVRLIHLSLPTMMVVAAFDERFRWSHTLPVSVSVTALVMMIPAALVSYRAIAANAFFSSHIRIQEDRGQTVVSTGPYRVVRHPGYAGSLVFNLLVPLALGSLLALVPGIGTALLLVYRTVKEDRVLLAELPGYRTYAGQVRYRLVPGLW